MRINESLEEYTRTVSDILNNDYYVFNVITGDMGKGKSCLATKKAVAVALREGLPFSYKDNLTYSRNELKKWVDGDEGGNGQKPEKTSIIADEIINMFFRRSWYEEDQIEGIKLLNMCRDRHLFIVGCVPNFWSLDSQIFGLVTFWTHVAARGKAWVFKKDDNPFEADAWHRKENLKIFAKYKNPYKCKNFVCELTWDDWTENERAEYYAVRNEKRKVTEVKKKDKLGKREVYYLEQRYKLICFLEKKGINQIEIAGYLGVKPSAVSQYKARFEDKYPNKVLREE